MDTFKTFLSSRYAPWVIALIVIVILLLVFRFGMLFGEYRALYAAHFGQYYERNFLGGRPPLSDHGFENAHGASGTILSVGSASISVKADNGSEQTIVVSSTTAIRRLRDDVTLAELAPGDHVVILGDPTDQGSIDAKLIRVLPEPGSPQTATATPSMPHSP